MKVLVDLDRALADGQITADEHARLKVLGSGQSSDLALNILIGFGVVAVTAGFMALFPSTVTVAGTGLLLALVGLALVLGGGPRWRILGDILLVCGALLLASGLVLLDEGSARAFLGAAAVFAVGAAAARNGLLAALTVLALSGALGGRTGYAHATYLMGMEAPAATIAVFSGLSLALVAAAPRLPASFARLGLIAARTGAILVNVAFLIGSLWGDTLRGIALSADAFTVLWAPALAGAAIWAWRTNRRWVLVTATVFGAIHLYTQWFERLGAEPVAVLLGGGVAIAIGFALKSALAAMPQRAAA